MKSPKNLALSKPNALNELTVPNSRETPISWLGIQEAYWKSWMPATDRRVDSYDKITRINCTLVTVISCDLGETKAYFLWLL